MAHHDLTTGGAQRISRASEGVQTDTDKALAALIALSAAQLSQNNQAQRVQKEHHYHSNVGLFGSLLMLSGVLSIALVSYSLFKLQPVSETLSGLEDTAAAKIESVKNDAIDSVTPDFVVDGRNALTELKAWLKGDEPAKPEVKPYPTPQAETE